MTRFIDNQPIKHVCFADSEMKNMVESNDFYRLIKKTSTQCKPDKHHCLLDILNYAIELKNEALTFYKKMVRSIKVADATIAINEITLDEERHKKKLEAMRDRGFEFIKKDITVMDLSDSIVDVKHYDLRSCKEFFTMAITKENTSIQLYKQLTQFSKQEDMKVLFSQLAKDEAQHKLNLETEYGLMTF